MKTRFLFLSLLICTSILWGCTPEVVNTIPAIEQTATQPPIMEASPRPSATVTWANVPEIVSPSPSATIPAATATETPLLPTVTLELCRPGELDGYLNEWTPIADQLIILAREVSQLEELSKSRVEEILAESDKLKPAIDILTVPTCLKNAHQKTDDAIFLLQKSINYLLEENFDKAKKDLQESFSAIARAMVDIAFLSEEESATSTPTQ